MKIIQPTEGKFTCVLVQPHGNLAFFGTSVGLVEIWDLPNLEKITEVRYLKLNEFNEQIPIQDSVVNLAAPRDFSVVYAFMGVAAYCIDTELKTIIQQIPVVRDELIVWGNVSPVLGEIAVLTTSGYLSRWSPKFFERTAAIEFALDIDDAYVLHDHDESRIIIILENGHVILGNLEGEKYLYELEMNELVKFIGRSQFDYNEEYWVLVEEDQAKIFQKNENLETIAENLGKLPMENSIRTAVLQKIQGKDPKYLRDTRLNRQSVDRYVAELETQKGQLDQTHSDATPEEDSKTLDYAFNEYYSETVEKRSRSLAIINRLAKKHNVTSNYIGLAWRRGHPSKEIISYARFYQFEEFRRNRRIQNYLTFVLIFSILHFLFPQILNFGILLIILEIALYLATLTILLLWRKTNRSPKLVDVQEYRAARVLTLILILISFTILLSLSNLKIPYLK